MIAVWQEYSRSGTLLGSDCRIGYDIPDQEHLWETELATRYCSRSGTFGIGGTG